MHLRVSAPAIFWETSLNWSTVGYNKLLQYQLLYSFVSHLQWPANMVEKSILPWLWERSIFFNFQNASPRKCSGHFLSNSTLLNYSRILQTGRVSASVLIPTPLVMTCEKCRNIENHYGRGRFFAIFKIHLRVSALAIFWETPPNWSTLGYYYLVE